jgi:hypothetical protein
MSVVAERPLGRSGKVALVGLFISGMLLASADVFSGVSFLVYMPVGAYLVARRPRNAVGWLLLGIAFAFIGTTTSPGIDMQALARGEPTLIDALNVWVAGWAGLAAFVGFLALTIIFPGGRLPRAEGRRTAIALLLIGVAVVVLTAFAPSLGVFAEGGTTQVPVPNPAAVLPDLPIWPVLSVEENGVILIIALLVTGVVRMVLRFRRSTGLERLQLRWLAAAIAFVLIGILAGLLLTGLLGGDLGGAVWIPVAIAYPSIPLAVGIAVMRYRLFEIDRIVSRTVSWAVVSGILGAIFVGGVIALQAALGGFTQGETLAVAGSTLASFALFQPVRRRVQDTVDRRFDRARYDAQRTVDAFAEEVRNEVDLVRLRMALVATSEDAVRPVGATVWLREPAPNVSRPRKP